MATQKMQKNNSATTVDDVPFATSRIDVLLDSVGDGSGTTEMATTADEYMYKPSVNVIVERLLIGMESTTRMSPDEYGDLTALSNGIDVTAKYANGDVLHRFTIQPIKATWHWGLLAGSDVQPSAFEAGSDRILVRWTLSKAAYPFRLLGTEGQYFSFNVRDDLSGLTSHLVSLQGYVIG